MRDTAFARFRQGWTDARFAMCDAKSKEYTNDNDGDRLYNFRFIASLLKKAPSDELTVWAVYFLKHVLGIIRFIRTRKMGTEGIIGRIDDAQNYLDLLRAMIQEGEKPSRR